MSLIHDALQNVESTFVNQESKPVDEHQHSKNKLYKVNKFDINISNSLIMVLMVSGLFSACYILYADFTGNTLAAEQYESFDSAITTSEVSNENLLLEDINFEVIESTALLEPELLNNTLKNNNENIDAIEGDIVGAFSHKVADAAVFESTTESIAIVQQDDRIYELKDDSLDTLYAKEDIIAEKSNIESNYFSLQQQAYQYIMNKDFSQAIPTLKKILQNDHNDYYANINMVLIDIEEKRFIEANQRLQRLKSIYPFENRIQELSVLVKANQNG